jgi:hypothetical protein
MPTGLIMVGVADLNFCLFTGPSGNLSALLVRVA